MGVGSTIKSLALMLGLALAATLPAACQKEVPQQVQPVQVSVEQLRAASHAHIRHVTASWPETPGKVGLAVILEQELDVASREAALAIRDPADLNGILEHLRKVRHALDPSQEPQGPGQGFGVIRAADGVAKHIELAADAPGASDYVKLNWLHVATPAQNIAFWGRNAMKMSGEILAAKSISSSFSAAREVAELLQEMQLGTGGRTWKANEGGLEQLKLNLRLLTIAEGM